MPPEVAGAPVVLAGTTGAAAGGAATAGWLWEAWAWAMPSTDRAPPSRMEAAEVTAHADLLVLRMRFSPVMWG
ncbi:hypothetical protein GCM10010442_26130 [Kitasatospora kifunensis]